MKYSEKAVEALKSSEAKLRDIIAEALQANSYGEVARVAHAVEVVAELISGLGEGKSPITQQDKLADVSIPQLPAVNQSPIVRNPAQALKRNQYPVFMRDGDRLVKIAWSKKERKPYEHRAPKATVSALVSAVLRRKGEGKLFEAAEVLPLLAEGGEEYPSYQSYLALAWLRHIGIVSKKGREGYIIKRGASSAEQIAKHWEELPIIA